MGTWPQRGHVMDHQLPTQESTWQKNKRKVNVDTGPSCTFFENKSTDPNSAIELLTISEVAGVLKISKTGVWRLKDAGHLPFHKVGGSVRFSKSDLVSYLEKSRVEAVD